jgi:hypothetical protein
MLYDVFVRAFRSKNLVLKIISILTGKATMSYKVSDFLLFAVITTR